MVHAPSALPRLSLKGVPKHSPEHGRRYKSGESILKGSILPSIQGSQGLPNPRDRKGANLLFPKGNLREVPTRSINVGNVCAAMYCLFARPGSRGGKKSSTLLQNWVPRGIPIISWGQPPKVKFYPYQPTSCVPVLACDCVRVTNKLYFVCVFVLFVLCKFIRQVSWQRSTKIHKDGAFACRSVSRHDQ